MSAVILGVARIIVPGVCLVGLCCYALLLVALVGEAWEATDE